MAKNDSNSKTIRANARFAKLAPRKARVIANMVRGRDVAEALQLLQFTNKRGARVLKQVLESAVANASHLMEVKPEEFGGIDIDDLYVSKATVDKAPNRFFRRWRPRAMGRATRVTKGVSHICIELDLRQ